MPELLSFDFRRLFATLPGLYVLLLPDLTICAVSDAYLRATMTERNALIGRGLFEVFPENPDADTAHEQPNIRASLEKVLQTCEPDTLPMIKYDVQRPIEQGGGYEERFWSLSSAPYCDETGLAIAIIHRVEDVTEFVRLTSQGVKLKKMTGELRLRAGEMEAELLANLKQTASANARLRDSEARFALVARATNDTVWDWDLATNEVWWNGGIQKVFGYAPRAVEPTVAWWYQHIHLDDRDRVTDGIHAAIEGDGEKWSDEYRYLCADGGVKYVLDRGFIIRHDGKPVRMLGAMQDITAFKRSQEMLLERARLAALSGEIGAALNQDAELKNMLGNCTDALVKHLQVAFARIWTFNQAENMLELQASSGIYTHLDGAHARVPVGKFKIGLIAQERQPHLTNDVPNDPRVSDKAWAQSEQMIAFAGYPLIIEDRLVGVMAAFARRPLTELTLQAMALVSVAIANGIERKQFEAERSSLLAREQTLRHSAEEANRLKDEFLATLSHELRTPLTAILGWARMLNGGQLNAEQSRRALETIERNAKAQAQLIEDVLDVSRIISGKLRLDVRSVDLTHIIETVVDAMRPAMDAKRIRLQRSLDAGAGKVSGDPNRLQQIIWNLLSNAIKFTPRDGQVQVGLERVGSHVEITVTDNGQGIDAETLPFVFERFRQSDSSTTRRHAGLGLGLAIVRHLVEMHGGSVKAASDGEGRGATFTLGFPLLAISVPPDEILYSKSGQLVLPPMVIESARFVCPPELKDLRILIVDDEADTRLLLRAIFTKCQARISEAASAVEALSRLAESQFDILISDIGMPERDGYELIRQVRLLAPERGGSIPAIALTAFARAEDRLRALTAGFQMYIPKPVEPAELVTIVAGLAASRNVA